MEPIDFATPMGTPVTSPLTTGEWRVARSEDLGARSYGQWVELVRGQDTLRYAHLSVRYVERGDVVEGGVLLGETGSSGKSTGPHLHFEASDDVWRWAKFIWEVESVLTKQDKQWIEEMVRQQNQDLLAAVTVGRLRGASVPSERVEVTRQWVKANNLKQLKG